MAQSLIASVYGCNENDLGNVLGKTMGFPTQGIVIRALSPAVSYSGVSCNSIIQLLPAGSNSVSANYACPTATGTLITAANA